MDKRTARREYRSNFMNGIHEYMQSKQIKDEQDNVRTDESNVVCCIRKRPLFEKEYKNGEFDVISCSGKKEVIVHDARMHANMKDMLMTHHSFSFYRVFNEKCSNDEVYKDLIQPLVHSSFSSVPRVHTVLVYGQTGSGKTYTISSMYTQMAHDIFHNPSYRETDTISISIIELDGDNVKDILNHCIPCNLVTCADGTVQAFPCVEVSCKSSEELLNMIQYGVKIRHTEGTGVNDTSSRSHSFIQIFINDSVLIFTDLAGSEHKIDSMYHSAERRKECSKINSSLAYLKECIVSRKLNQDCSFIYRKCKLTMLLKTSFNATNATTIILSCISPSSKDTEHSLNTIRHTALMDITADNSVASETTQVGAVDISRISKRNRDHGTPDLQTSNGNENVYHNEIVLTPKEKLLQLKKRETEAMRQLRPEYRKLLQNARASLGSNELQSRRMRRVADVMTFSNAKSTAIAEFNVVDETSVDKTIVTTKLTKEKIKLYQKLYKSIYSDSAIETAASNILQRQLQSLLLVKGFSKDEIKLFNQYYNDPNSNMSNEAFKPIVESNQENCSTTRFSVSASGNRAEITTSPPLVSIKRQILSNCIEDSQSIQSSLENISHKHTNAYITASQKLEAEIEKRKRRQEQAKERVRNKLTNITLVSSSPDLGNCNVETELAAMKLEQELELRKQRQIQAREKAKQLEANRVARLKQSIVLNNTSKGVNGTNSNDMNELLGSMEVLQNKLNETDITSTSMFAIRKQLALLNSKVIKLKRKPVGEPSQIVEAGNAESQHFQEDDRAVF